MSYTISDFTTHGAWRRKQIIPIAKGEEKFDRKYKIPTLLLGVKLSYPLFFKKKKNWLIKIFKVVKMILTLIYYYIITLGTLFNKIIYLISCAHYFLLFLVCHKKQSDHKGKQLWVHLV
jgi:hypothetical protein